MADKSLEPSPPNPSPKRRGEPIHSLVPSPLGRGLSRRLQRSFVSQSAPKALIVRYFEKESALRWFIESLSIALEIFILLNPMPSPLPGMDPYLEHPQSWPNFHHRLITAIAIELAPQLRPKYRVVVEEAIYQTKGQDSLLVGIPDVAVQKSAGSTASLPSQTVTEVPIAQPLEVELPMPEVIRQGYLEIREVATSEVVTVIEVLSPTNKRPGEGRKNYEAKRQTLLASAVNLVEIDLLRRWDALLSLPEQVHSHYRILVSASVSRPRASLYAFNLTDAIPAFPLPLAPEDVEPIVNLQKLVGDIYDQSGYDLVINYQENPTPPLRDDDNAWLNEWLQQQRVRS